jgi:hypothetical protein
LCASWRDWNWAKIGYQSAALILTAFIEIVIIYLGGVPLAGLPRELPQNATVVTVLTVVTQRAEISKIAGLLLTVDGILLGLSPILLDKIESKPLGVISVTVAGIALIESLMTIVFADGNQDFTTVYRFYFFDVFLFGLVAIFYILSSWLLLLPKQKSKDKTE